MSDNEREDDSKPQKDEERTDDDLLESIRIHWEQEYELGQDLSLEELCASCPHLIPQARRLIERSRRFLAAERPQATSDEFDHGRFARQDAELGRGSSVPVRVVDWAAIRLS